MEDSGIDSDSKTVLNKMSYSHVPDHDTEEINDINHEHDSESTVKDNSNDEEEEEEHLQEVIFKGRTIPKLRPASMLQKRLEKQVLETRKLRQKEKSIESQPKKLIPRSRLKVPKGQSTPNKGDAHPLVSWETDSEDDMDYHPISESATDKLISQDEEQTDLDLIPPKRTTKCICFSLHCVCSIQ